MAQGVGTDVILAAVGVLVVVIIAVVIYFLLHSRKSAYTNAYKQD